MPKTATDRLERQQAWLCVTLLLGLLSYLTISVVLRSLQYVTEPDNLAALDRVGIQLFTPYIGIAVGGFFGNRELGNPPEPAGSRFLVALLTLVTWDVLVVGYVLLVLFGYQFVEDFVRFSDTILPVLATFVAAIMTHYFGAQPGESPKR